MSCKNVSKSLKLYVGLKSLVFAILGVNALRDFDNDDFSGTLLCATLCFFVSCVGFGVLSFLGEPMNIVLFVMSFVCFMVVRVFPFVYNWVRRCEKELEKLHSGGLN
jgi:hypothetical protein